MSHVVTNYIQEHTMNTEFKFVNRKMILVGGVITFKTRDNETYTIGTVVGFEDGVVIVSVLDGNQTHSIVVNDITRINKHKDVESANKYLNQLYENGN